MAKIDRIIKKYFNYLTTEFGFTITSKEYSPAMMGNFIIKFEKDDICITIIRDRNQVFVTFSTPKIKERDKEKILAEIGVPFDRYPLTKGSWKLWKGYEIKNQSADLKKHLKLILNYLNSK
jgi:hypothetical protein